MTTAEHALAAPAVSVSKRRGLPSGRALGLGALVVFAAIVLVAPSRLPVDARIAFVVFAAAVYGWVGTDLNDTFVALAAALSLTLTGVDEPDEFFESLGDPTVWLLLAAFLVAAAAHCPRSSAECCGSSRR